MNILIIVFYENHKELTEKMYQTIFQYLNKMKEVVFGLFISQENKNQQIIIYNF